MSGIRGKNTTPERQLRKALHARGFRFRIHAKKLPGRPDIVLPKWRAAIMVHGCFWHRHRGCRFTTAPSTRAEFWEGKFRSNVERDARQLGELRRSGWRTAIVWECCLRPKGAADQVADEIARWLRGNDDNVEMPAEAVSEPSRADCSVPDG